MTQEEVDEDEEMWYSWEEADYENNKLFYEYDLSYLEELCQREPMKMKERV